MKEGHKSARYRVLTRHVERLAKEIDSLKELDQRYFWVRLTVLIIGALGLFLAYQSRQSSVLLISILVFLAIFSGVVYLNRRVRRSIFRFKLSWDWIGERYLLDRITLLVSSIPSPMI